MFCFLLSGQPALVGRGVDLGICAPSLAAASAESKRMTRFDATRSFRRLWDTCEKRRWSQFFLLHRLNHRVPALSKSWTHVSPRARCESPIVSPPRNAANSLSAFRG